MASTAIRLVLDQLCLHGRVGLGGAALLVDDNRHDHDDNDKEDHADDHGDDDERQSAGSVVVIATAIASRGQAAFTGSARFVAVDASAEEILCEDQRDRERDRPGAGASGGEADALAVPVEGDAEGADERRAQDHGAREVDVHDVAARRVEEVVRGRDRQRA